MSDVLVSRYMTPCPVTIHGRETLATAYERMRRYQIRHLPVTDGGALIGIVSDRDLRFAETAAEVNPETTLVERAMTPDPYVAAAEDSLAEVAAEMATKKYGCAIVLHRGEIVGLFTAVDALAALADILGPKPGAPRRFVAPGGALRKSSET